MPTETVLDQVDASDSVLAANPVQGLQQRDRREASAVHGDRVSPFVLDLDVDGYIRR
jgi:hypothetical protein